MIANKKAIFWDNDGILVDTEKYYFEATQQILKKVDFELTKEMYVELFLIQGKGVWHLLDQEKYSADFIKNLRTERDNLYLEFLLTKEILMDGIEDILANLSERYKMAVVTSSKPMHFNAIHSRTGILKYFDFTITANDYIKFKPDPEPYLTALKRMMVDSLEGIAIEDSRRGLISAKAAGLQCIIVWNELTRTSDFSEADYILSNIRNLTQIL
jgi:HAD superfamily hydrolase (TIGR01509 family)